LRLEKTDIEDWYLLGGVFYSSDEIDEDYLLENGGGILGLALGLDGLSTRWQQDSDSIAAFGHVEWEFTDKFRLTLGARYTEEDRDWSGCTFDSGDGTLAGLWNNILTPFLLIPAGAPDPGLIGPGDCGVYDDIDTSPTFGQFAVYSQKIDTNKAMGKITLDYSPSEDVLIYGTISTGFKSGGFNGAAVQTHQGLIAYRPEELTSFELGIK
jgi:iron complex outermembrane receptor protein